MWHGYAQGAIVDNDEGLLHFQCALVDVHEVLILVSLHGHHLHRNMRELDLRNGRVREIVNFSQARRQENFQIVVDTQLDVVNQELLEPVVLVDQLLEILLAERGALVVLFGLDSRGPPAAEQERNFSKVVTLLKDFAVILHDWLDFISCCLRLFVVADVFLAVLYIELCRLDLVLAIDDEEHLGSLLNEVFAFVHDISILDHDAGARTVLNDLEAVDEIEDELFVVLRDCHGCHVELRARLQGFCFLVLVVLNQMESQIEELGRKIYF